MRLTKTAKRARAAASRKKTGIVKAVKALLKKTNPSAKISGASVVKLKGGALKITPIKGNPGRKDYRTLAAAQKAMDRLRAKGIYDAGIVYDAATRMYRLLWKGGK